MMSAMDLHAEMAIDAERKALEPVARKLLTMIAFGDPANVDVVIDGLMAERLKERGRCVKIAEDREASISYLNTSDYAAGERQACEFIAEAIRQ